MLFLFVSIYVRTVRFIVKHCAVRVFFCCSQLRVKCAPHIGSKVVIISIVMILNFIMCIYELRSHTWTTHTIQSKSA